MANAALTWALDHSQSRLASRLVIVVIADQLNFHQGKGWICWPGNKFIEKRCNLSDTAVTDSVKDLIELGELFADREPGKLVVFRMPKFEAWYDQKKSVEADQPPSRTAGVGTQNGGVPKTAGYPKRRVAPPSLGGKIEVVSYSNPEVPLKGKTPPTPPQAGGTPPASASHTLTASHKPQVQFRNEKIIECEDGICRVEMGHRSRIFTRRELEATHGTFWTCDAMAKYLRARNFQVRIELGTVEREASTPTHRVRPEVLQRAAVR